MLAFAMLVAVSAPAAKAHAATNCSVSIVGTTNTVGTANSRIHLNDTRTEASATVVVSGDPTCTEVVTIVSWEAPNANFNIANLNAQKVHSFSTQTLGVGTHVVKTSMADCFYQIDVLNSAHPKAADGTAQYRFEDGLMGWAQGGNKSCTAPVPTPKPIPTPTPTPTPVAPATVLPNTGPGNLVGLISAVTIGGATLHYFVTKKRLNRV